jgi:PKD repeat protein
MKWTILSLLCFYAVSVSSQTLSGQVNHYTRVVDIDTCTATIQVADTSGFLPGDRLLIIQMQGATISTTNNADFGQIQQIGSAGLYEFAELTDKSASGLILSHRLLNTYDPSGAVQCIRVFRGNQALVTAPLSAPAWNGQTGGVLVLDLDAELTLQADIDLRGSGFRGGIADINVNNNCSWLTFSNAYVYPANNWRGAAKGEGIAQISPGLASGRGPMANGGGGANDHNAGGGGGGNVSKGGNGGRNEEPATFGCTGSFPGLGGRATGLFPDRLFMGGGGGAGHENNNNGTDGGLGGGIVIIKATAIIGNGHHIYVDGISATTASGDGGGGGGAGGSVALFCDSITELTISAIGGSGGHVNNAAQARCMGPGGGGAGGVILLSNVTDTPNIIIEPGSPGFSINSSACPDATNNAQTGQAGFVGALPAPHFPQGTDPIPGPPSITVQPMDTIACSSDTITLSVRANGEALRYQWQVNTGPGFQNLSGPQSDSISIFVIPLAQYRVLISSPCFPTLVSDTITVTGLSPASPTFSYTTTGNTVQFTTPFSGPGQVLWVFGDGNQSTILNPQHTYPSAGNYTVSLSITNACGTETYSLPISVGQAPQALFNQSQQDACAPALIRFSDSSSGLYTTRLWTFPGGQPSTDTAAQPLILYANPGTYPVSLQLQGPQGNSAISLPAAVTVHPYPIPSFSYQQNSNTLIFNNQSLNAQTYTWLFGDGNSSQEISPTHMYASPGTYTVTLNAQTPFCANAIATDITVQVSTATSALPGISAAIFPNPFHERLFFSRLSPNEDAIDYGIFTINGQPLLQGQASGNFSLDTSALVPGIYIIVLRSRHSIHHFQAIKL